jgi:hypothetical protein
LHVIQSAINRNSSAIAMISAYSAVASCEPVAILPHHFRRGSDP